MSDNTTNPAVALTWPDLIAHNKDLLLNGLEQIKDIPAELATLEDDPLTAEPAAESLLGASSILAQSTLTYGPERSIECLTLLIPILPRAFEEIGPVITQDNRVLAMSLLSLINIIRSAGLELAQTLNTTATVAEQRWPGQLAAFKQEMNERERWTLALAALVVGDMDTMRTVTGGGPLDDMIDPDATFDFNVQGFVRHLATAQTTAASLSNVLPALRNFIERFPHKLVAGTLSWDVLLYAGRASIETIGHEPSSSVAPTMAALISEITIRDQS